MVFSAASNAQEMLLVSLALLLGAARATADASDQISRRALGSDIDPTGSSMMDQPGSRLQKDTSDPKARESGAANNFQGSVQAKTMQSPNAGSSVPDSDGQISQAVSRLLQDIESMTAPRKNAAKVAGTPTSPPPPVEAARMMKAKSATGKTGGVAANTTAGSVPMPSSTMAPVTEALPMVEGKPGAVINATANTVSGSVSSTSAGSNVNVRKPDLSEMTKRSLEDDDGQVVPIAAGPIDPATLSIPILTSVMTNMSKLATNGSVVSANPSSTNASIPAAGLAGALVNMKDVMAAVYSNGMNQTAVHAGKPSSQHSTGAVISTNGFLGIVTFLMTVMV